MTRKPRRFDGCGRTARRSEGGSSPVRYMIGHLGSSLLLTDTNSDIGANARLIGGSQGHLVMLAAGVGAGEASAGAAAEVALEGMARQFVEVMPSFYGFDVAHERKLRGELESAVTRCQRSVVEIGNEAGDELLGTTLTAAYVLWPRMYLMHLGDSRAYLVRGADARRLTDDHVRRVGGGVPARRDGVMLTNALGAGIRRPSVDYSVVELDDEDTVVLCCPGLVDGLGDDARLGDLASGEGSAERSADALVRAARDGGGADATAVVARFRAAAPGTERPPS